VFAQNELTVPRYFFLPAPPPHYQASAPVFPFCVFSFYLDPLRFSGLEIGEEVFFPPPRIWAVLGFLPRQSITLFCPDSKCEFPPLLK